MTDKPTGLACPKCGEPVNTRMVAKSHPTRDGLFRKRYCRCGADVVSIERIIGADIEGMLVEGLGQGNSSSSKRGGPIGSDRSLLRQLIKRFGGTVTELDV